LPRGRQCGIQSSYFRTDVTDVLTLLVKSAVTPYCTILALMNVSFEGEQEERCYARRCPMALHPHILPPVPEATAAAVRAAFPKGNLYLDRRAACGTLYHDQLFAALYPSAGRPVEVPPWRLALVRVRQYIEGLTDRQAADAVRRGMAWH
jgi:transposase